MPGLASTPPAARRRPARMTLQRSHRRPRWRRCCWSLRRRVRVRSAGHARRHPRSTAATRRRDVAGQPLPIAIAVTVLDTDGRPLPDARVTFNAAPGIRHRLAISDTDQRQRPCTGPVDPRHADRHRDRHRQRERRDERDLHRHRDAPDPPLSWSPRPAPLSLGVGRHAAAAAPMHGTSSATPWTSWRSAWSSLDPAVISRERRLGDRALAGHRDGPWSPRPDRPGQIADTVIVGVGPQGTSFCGGRAVNLPAVGEVVLLTAIASGAERCLGAGTGGAEFALVLMNTSPNFGSSVSPRRARAGCRCGAARHRGRHGEQPLPAGR